MIYIGGFSDERVCRCGHSKYSHGLGSGCDLCGCAKFVIDRTS